jgi:hypothetical protein
MVEDHCPTVKEIVWEFYTNLHQRRSDSFHTWLRGTTIKAPLHSSMRVPRVRDLTYPWPIDHLPTHADIVACFAEGCLHQMELDRDGSFQMNDFSNDVRCIYHILASRVLPVISHTLITIERACYLYALLIEASINYGPLVTSTMMSV